MPTPRNRIDIIGRQVRHMTELVDDLLDASRVTRGLIQVETAVLDLASVIESAIEQSRPLIEARGHELDRVLPSSACFGARRPHAPGPGARQPAEQCRPLHAAGGPIDVAPRSRRRARPHPRARQRRRHRRGLPAASSSTSSARARARRTARSVVWGSAWRWCSASSSCTAARSKHAARALPREARSRSACRWSRRTRAGCRGDAPTPAHPARGLSVLLVDDNQDAAEALAALLRLQGHSVIIKHDGPGALEVPAAAVVDVFVLDIGLPGMNGYDLARRLRERHPNAVYIALTGYGQAEDRERSRSGGFRSSLSQARRSRCARPGVAVGRRRRDAQRLTMRQARAVDQARPARRCWARSLAVARCGARRPRRCAA